MSGSFGSADVGTAPNRHGCPWRQTSAAATRGPSEHDAPPGAGRAKERDGMDDYRLGFQK